MTEERCPYCGTEYSGELDAYGNLYCDCEGATIALQEEIINDLLAACESSLALLEEQVRIVTGCGIEPTDGYEEVNQLRAAIAKAKGGEG